MIEATTQLARDDNFSGDFADLVARHLEGELNDAECQQLHADLAALPQRRDEFVAMCLHAHLIAACVGLEFIDEEAVDDSSDDEDLLSGQTQASSAPAAAPVLGFLATALHGTIGYFSEGMPLAYLLATVVTGLGLLIGSLIHVSRPEQVAHYSVPSVVVEPKAQSVGRITGMVGCQWQEGSGFRIQGHSLPSPGADRRLVGRWAAGEGGESPIPNPQSLVALGDRYALSSGLMEITYTTGAKVILQGPVTYEAELNGGYLSVGKLTGKLEKGSGFRVQGSEAANHKSEIINQKSSLSTIHYPLFTIKTPTATVTDLGTEFGVEVSSEGVTETQVFVGAVKIARAGDENSIAVEQIVRAGSAVRLNAQKNRLTVIQPSGQRFVRALPLHTAAAQADAYAELVLSMKPAVYYRMEQWPKADKQGCYVLLDSAPGAHHGEAHLDEAFGGPRCRGRFGSALDLHGPAVGDYAIVPDYPKTDNDQLSVSAWVWALASHGSIVQNWSEVRPQGAIIGQFALAVHSDHHLLAALLPQSGQRVFVAERDQEFPRGQWQHVAFVADGAMLRLYRNGIEVGTTPYRGISRQGLVKNLSIGCAMDASGARPRDIAGFWDGRLDEIAVFNHALSAGQVRQLYTGPVNNTKPFAGSSGDDKD